MNNNATAPYTDDQESDETSTKTSPTDDPDADETMTLPSATNELTTDSLTTDKEAIAEVAIVTATDTVVTDSPATNSEVTDEESDETATDASSTDTPVTSAPDAESSSTDEHSTDTSIADGHIDAATNVKVEPITDNTIIDDTEETTTILEDIMDDDIDNEKTTGCYYNGTAYFDAEDVPTSNPCSPYQRYNGEVVCAQRECIIPSCKENCTALPPRDGACCPDSWECMEDIITTEATEGDMEAVTETIIKEPVSELIVSPQNEADETATGARVTDTVTRNTSITESPSTADNENQTVSPTTDSPILMLLPQMLPLIKRRNRWFCH